MLSRRAVLKLTALAGLPRVAWASAPLAVADGWRWIPLIQEGDALGGQRFGYDPDFCAVFPLAPDRVLLWVNHEAPPGRLDEPEKWGRPPTVDDLRASMGGSVVELRRGDGGWERAPSGREWRLDGTTELRATGPALAGEALRGSMSNCGGGTTPWGTVLSCEENPRHFVAEGTGARTGRVGGGGGEPGLQIPGLLGEHFGWVVEADPRDRSWMPRKHTALGRWRHESAAVRADAGKPLRIYMPDDRAGGALWRYSSKHAWYPRMERDAGSALLSEGRLEVLRLEPGGTATWVQVHLGAPVSRGTPIATAWPNLPEDWKLAASKARFLRDVYPTEAAFLVDAWLAGLLCGASALGNPEGCCLWGDEVAVALTGSSGLTAPFSAPVDEQDGVILAIRDDPAGPRWRVVVRGAEAFTGPDNVAAGSDGALLIATDAREARLASHGGANVLLAWDGATLRHLLTAPPGAEPSGPVLAPGGGIFLSIQHPDPTWGPGVVGWLGPAPG
jgi:secreted PhoX family phosphatase